MRAPELRVRVVRRDQPERRRRRALPPRLRGRHHARSPLRRTPPHPLAQTVADLRCRKGELTAQLDDEPTDTYDDLDSTELQDLVDDILTHDDQDDLRATKALFQQLNENIDVDGRHAVRPTFRVPSFVPAVRNVSGLVGLMDHNPNRSADVLVDGPALSIRPVPRRR